MRTGIKRQIQWATRALSMMFIASLSGCDTMVTYQFEVTNESTQRIAVAFKTPQMDTTMAIDAGQSKVILERNQLNSSIKPYFASSENIWWFSKLEIRAIDSRAVNKEIRIASAWTFSKKNEKTGVYRLLLTNQDF